MDSARDPATLSEGDSARTPIQLDDGYESDVAEVFLPTEIKAKLELPPITDPNEPLLRRTPYPKNDKLETVTLTARGQHLISGYCNTEALVSAFNMPSRPFVIVKGTVKDTQFSRYDTAIAMLIASRGKTPPNKKPCSVLKLNVLAQARVLPGISHNACCYCRWIGNPKGCDYFTGPVTTTGKKSKISKAVGTATATSQARARKRARIASGLPTDPESCSGMPKELIVVDGYVYQRIGPSAVPADSTADED